MSKFTSQIGSNGPFYFLYMINLCLSLYVITLWNPSLFPKLKFSSLCLWALFLSTMIYLPVILSVLDPFPLFMVSCVISAVGTYAINSFLGLNGTNLLLAAAGSILSILILTGAWSFMCKKIDTVYPEKPERAFVIRSIALIVAQLFIVPIFMSLVIFPKANYLTCLGYYLLASIWLTFINSLFRNGDSKEAEYKEGRHTVVPAAALSDYTGQPGAGGVRQEAENPPIGVATPL